MFGFYIKRNFSNIGLLHPYLLQSLKRRGQYPLKHFQQESLVAIQNNKNVFVNSCTGSGKTLAYLIPVMNYLLHRKDQNCQQNHKGAVILTLNKELVAQVYHQIKSIDHLDRLSTYRIGSLSQSKQANPVFENSQSKQQNSNGFINFILWNKIDILISTPQSLMNQLTIFTGQRKNIINPLFVVIDQADVLLQLDKNVRKNTDKVLKYLKEQAQDKILIKYLLTASSFPKNYRKEPAEQKLKQIFKELDIINGINRHKLPEKLQLFYIQMKETQSQKLQEEKISYVKRIILERYEYVNKRKDQRIIIFCKQKIDIQRLNKLVINDLNTSAVLLYAQLKIIQREHALKLFSSGEARILISSELGSRGLDFNLPVDCIIQYDMAENIVSFLNRAGRTARNDLYGQVITFVQEKNKEFFEHLKQLRHYGDELDQMFSRKRSYSKLYKQKTTEK